MPNIYAGYFFLLVFTLYEKHEFKIIFVTSIVPFWYAIHKLMNFAVLHPASIYFVRET